jgi:hypothetical protein
MEKNNMEHRTQKVIMESKLAVLESKRLLREFAEDPVDMSDALATADSPSLPKMSGEKGKALGQVVGRAAFKAGREKLATKAAEEALKQGAERFGLKLIPGIGTAISFTSTIAQGGLFLKALVEFTDSLLENTGEELTGIRSLIGEYSILDASPEDMKKIAEAIKKLPAETVREIEEPYKEMELRFKRFLVDFLFTLKELSLGASLGIAALLVLTPTQPIKDMLFDISRKFTEIKNKAPAFISFAIDVFQNVFGGAVPVLGFINDYDRIAAFGEIDDAINQGVKKTTKDRAIDYAVDVGQAGYVGADALAAASDSIAAGIGDAVGAGIRSIGTFGESKQRTANLLNFDKFLK